MSEPESKHFVEMTSYETALIKALVEDKLEELKNSPYKANFVRDPVPLLESILAKLQGGEGTGVN